MFMGQWQQGCAVRERLNDHHGSRYHDQHEADGKASSASRSALGCSLSHVGRLLQRSLREPSDTIRHPDNWASCDQKHLYLRCSWTTQHSGPR
jgi:hypothetical protein